ncbi:MAG: alpha/beta hydrolase [Parvularculaceae bacterium]|nr:alpha/beta hydrolase [Parvularculaceae bacterium]
MAGAVLAALVFGSLFVLGGCAAWRAEKKSPAIGKLLPVGAETIHILDIGPRDSSLPPVVLIHGASVNLRDMKLALGDELSKTRRVLIVDRPGRGYSTRPRDGWRLDRQARLIRDAVRAEGAENPILVGQSFGGSVALAYALEFQNELSGLVLLAPVSHEWPGGVAWYNKASGLPVIGFLLRRAIIPVYARLSAKSGVAKSFDPDIAPAGYYEKSGLALLFRPGDFKNNASDIRRLKAQIIAMQGRYGSLVLPTAIVTGDADATVSPNLHSAALAREIPGATHLVLAGTGHALHHAETGRILDVIDDVSVRARRSEKSERAVYE